ncbi:GerAB/ArcD/ProY family transporter [Cytobacillus depressus]|uniref:GerAB/ArcD/ProY family transporter n=2 Tax=Cytobacillus depressus TaxID=1602942 RepID=A0A6L3VE08_9BACI|nr:GerAB/ArcD/ProY family transporter [Cytobacillus depressus]
MKNIKISSLQMAMLMYPTIMATAILSIPSTTANYARQDMWLSPILASIIGFITMFVIYKLHKLFPDKTIIQMNELIIGKFLGKVLSFIFLLYFILTTGQIIRDYGEFIVSSFLFKTPLVVIISSMVLLSAFTVHAGLEVISRVCQLIFPIFVIPFILLIVLLSPEFELGNILPILERGMISPIKGAIPTSGWFGEIIIIIFLLPYLTDKEKAYKYGMMTVFWVMITLVILNLTVLFVLGTTTSTKVYPLMNVSRYISYADFFENLDAITMAVWILGAFIKITVFYYAVVLSTTQLLNLSDYRSIVWPIGILLVEFSFWSIPNMMALSHESSVYFPFYAFIIQTLIPMLLLLIAFIRKKSKPVKG